MSASFSIELADIATDLRDIDSPEAFYTLAARCRGAINVTSRGGMTILVGVALHSLAVKLDGEAISEQQWLLAKDLAKTLADLVELNIDHDALARFAEAWMANDRRPVSH